MATPIPRTNLGKVSLHIMGLLLVLMICGCSSATPSLQNHSQMIQSVSPESVLKRISHTDTDVIRAMAHIEIRHPSGRFSTKAAILLKKPASLRIEAIPIIGPVNCFLSIHENVFKIFFPQQGVFYIGQATPENLAFVPNIFPEGLGIEDMVPIMFGTYPTLGEKNVSLKSSLEKERYRIDMIYEGNILQSLWIDLKNQRLVEVQGFKGQDRKMAYTAIFEAFDTPDLLTITMPHKITLISEAEGHPKVTIRYSKVQRVPDIETTDFDLQIPPGINPTRLD